MTSKTKWLPALMNLIGLGIAFSVFLILMSQVWWDFRYDRFKGGRDVYVVEGPSFREGLYSDHLLRPLVQMVADCSPDIALACDYVAQRNDKLGLIQLKDRGGEWVPARDANFAMTEPAVLDVFNVVLTLGRKADFAREGDVLIAESAAKQFFPDRNPIGEVLKYLDPEGEKEGRIVGTYKDRRENETMVNGFLIHEGETDLTLPNYNAHTCFVKLAPGADLDAVREAVGKVQLGSSVKDLRITQIHEARFERDRDYWGRKSGGNRLLCYVLTAIAILFLGIAGFNYINFAMAAIPFRIKEINSRKVFGASRGQLVWRQVGEAAVLVACAFLAGVLAMRTISGTSLGTFLSWNMTPEKNGPVIGIGVAAAVLLTAVAGLVPAFYSTSFQPALALKGSFVLSVKGGGLRSVTVTLQYVLTFIFLICALVLHRQTAYMVNNRQLGFDFDRVLKMESHLYSPLAEVVARLRDIPGVAEVSRGDSPMQASLSSMGEIRNEALDEVVQYSWRMIPTEYAGFFHLQLADGRLPLPGEEKVALVNASFSEATSLGVGDEIAHFSGKYTIIGILRNFHARSLENAFSPLVFFVGDKSNYASLLMRVEPGADVPAILSSARRIYAEMKHLEDADIETGFLDREIARLYEQESRQTRLVRVSSILSLIITLIGIFGVVWLDARLMRKEIAIRKVNGATRREILLQIGRKYLWIALTGFAIAVPAAIAVCRHWLQQFAFRTNMPAWLFLLALAVVLLVTLAVVALQAWRAASANPVDSLKNE